ncbi:MAG: tetratricopeptide repeat protein [Planctomycetota bacterium]
MWGFNQGLVGTGLLLHLGACTFCILAARSRGKLSPVEKDVVLISAVFIPVFGPALAWTIPVGDDRRLPSGSTEMLHKVEQDLQSTEQPYVPKLYSGDFEQDLSREINAMSYYEVLKNGDMDQKRNALRKLARMGEHKHLVMIKKFYHDPEPELRLCAYLEIDRLRIRHESKISELKKQLRECRVGRPIHEGRKLEDDCLAELADAVREYGSCGILDENMADFQLRQALDIAAEALRKSPKNWRAALVKALIHKDLNELDDAEKSLADLPEESRQHPAIRMMRAKLCFSRRDFEGARREALALRDSGQEVPEWLAVLMEDAIPTS